MNGSSCYSHHHHRRFRRTAGLKSSSHRRPKRASAKTPTVFASSSFQQRDLCEGDEGEDVEILQRDLVEEGLLDQKHANGYVAFLDIFFFSVGLLLRVVVCLLSLSSSNIYTKTLLNFALSNVSLYMHNITKTTNVTQTLQRPNDRGDRDASATVRFTRHRRMDRVGKVGVSRRDERNADDQRREASAGAADGEREEGAGKRADVLHERGEFG